MPKTKKVVAPEPEKEEDEPLDPTPVKAIRRKTEKKDDVLEKALDKLLLRLASNDPTELQQFTDLPLKLIDPIAKGVAYYESTLKTISLQCDELLDWYIQKCQEDIDRCDEQIAAVKAGHPLEQPIVQPPEIKRTWLDWLPDKVFGKPKPKVSPQLEIYNIEAYKEELENRLSELFLEQAEVEELDSDNMFFMRWAVNLYRNRRSLGGHAFDLFGSLSDAQIVTQAENGNLSKDKIFFH